MTLCDSQVHSKVCNLSLKTPESFGPLKHFFNNWSGCWVRYYLVTLFSCSSGFGQFSVQLMSEQKFTLCLTSTQVIVWTSKTYKGVVLGIMTNDHFLSQSIHLVTSNIDEGDCPDPGFTEDIVIQCCQPPWSITCPREYMHANIESMPELLSSGNLAEITPLISRIYSLVISLMHQKILFFIFPLCLW